MCQSRTIPEKMNQKRIEWNENEEIQFDHVCKCGHVVAHHFYSFEVDEDRKLQEFMMDCLLCGKGARSNYFANTECSGAVQNSGVEKVQIEKVVGISLASTIDSMLEHFEKDPKFIQQRNQFDGETEN